MRRPQIPAAARGGPARTILLVEADPELRRYLVECAGALGYAVIEASGAVEALGILEEHPGNVDLLVTSVSLPGVSGCEVAARARVLRPGIALLYVAEYPGQIAWELDHSREEHLYLSRPYTARSVDEGIRKAMGLDRKLILVAGADADDRSFLREALEPTGYEVIESPVEKMPEDRRIDLLIIDSSRAGGGNFASVQRVRRANPAVRVVALTGKFPVFSKSPVFVRRPRTGWFRFSLEDLHARWKVRADASLPKPVSVQILIATINRLLNV